MQAAHKEAKEFAAKAPKYSFKSVNNKIMYVKIIDLLDNVIKEIK